MVRLIPRETKFFDMFAEMADNITEGARLLFQVLQNYDDVLLITQKIKDIEHRGDNITHAVMTKLNQTFITPFDREDIHRLASTLDDVLDLINGAAERLVTYKICNPPEAAADIAKIIVMQCEQLQKAVPLLEKNKSLIDYCVEINRLENEADELSRQAISKLFEHEKDPIRLIKVKELCEVLERATDRAEDVANVLESVVLKST